MRRLLLLVIWALPSQLSAQTVPTRKLGPVVATSVERFLSIAKVRSLPNGTLMVHDVVGQIVLLVDASLTRTRLVADNTSATNNMHGARGAGLLPFRADSTLLVDPVSLSAMVIAPDGKPTRVVAVSTFGDMPSLVVPLMGNPGLDSYGRLVFRRSARRGSQTVADALRRGRSDVDSAPLVRLNLGTRRLDTAAFIHVYIPETTLLESNGRMLLHLSVNPMPLVDDWALRPDGSIAILRADYHVDIVDLDGRVHGAPRLPFAWRRLTDSLKQYVVDSAGTVLHHLEAEGRIRIGFEGQIEIAPDDKVSGNGTRNTAPATSASSTSQIGMVPPNDLPDFAPAFTAGALRADSEGKLWIRTIPSRPSSDIATYDVVDVNGRLFERVTIPRSSAIIGFGPHGTVYLGVRDSQGLRLARASEP